MQQDPVRLASVAQEPPAEARRVGRWAATSAASVLQASGFRGHATVFRLSAAVEAESRLEPALRRNAAARTDSLEATHNPEVAGSTPAPASERPRKRGLSLASEPSTRSEWRHPDADGADRPEARSADRLRPRVGDDGCDSPGAPSTPSTTDRPDRLIDPGARRPRRQLSFSTEYQTRSATSRRSSLVRPSLR